MYIHIDTLVKFVMINWLHKIKLLSIIIENIIMSFILSVTKMQNALINSEQMILNVLAYQDLAVMDSRVKGK